MLRASLNRLMLPVIVLLLSFLLGSADEVVSKCEGLDMGTPPDDHADAPSEEDYAAALKDLDMDAVKADMTKLLTDSKDCWPADFGHYGPFFVRLAWHCSGSFRATDGKGGCGGGRQRFEPERSWPDNTNLDKARALLSPLKTKYGDALSWGDLFILAGTTALRDMGTPIKKMCFGRVDDADGSKSMALGPSSQQEKDAPCDINGKCKAPLGATTVGLVYVNPEGPVTEKGGKPQPDPVLSAGDIRDSFGRMGHDPRRTVALIGAHAFGKVHGACSAEDGAGLLPKDAFAAGKLPWQGKCGTGKGPDAVTAGFEGVWTTEPLKFDNEFFKVLLDHKDYWEKYVGPGGHYQWRIKDGKATDPKYTKLVRLTSDVALLHDEQYLKIVTEFANDLDAFGDTFDKAWYNLTTYFGSGTWSAEAKCDDGKPFPEELRHPIIPDVVMLANDLVVVNDSVSTFNIPKSMLPSVMMIALVTLSAFGIRRFVHGQAPESHDVEEDLE
mmetsp:Transcript_79480/g.178047  ORF Transcript_79480/g.178047 Transcript_79480/m.178047 type:complete len:498 (+) Transcript_79480:51-1544(+)